MTSNYRECTLILLDHEADLEVEDSEGKAALHHACEAAQSIITSVLLEFGASVEAVDRLHVFFIKVSLVNSQKLA